MFDTHVTVVGTALNKPEKRITKNDSLVATFRVASRARRFDKEKEQWVDGSNFRVRVNCWRRLGEFVLGSIVTGDPVVVYGRIVTREWTTEQGEARLAYEIEAEAVGHDLARGRSSFTRWRPDPFGTVVEDADTESRVNGEVVQTLAAQPGPFPADEYGSGGYESGGFGLADANGLGDDRDALAVLASIDPTGGDGEGGDGDGDGDSDGEGSGDSGSGGSRRRRGRQPVPA
jgi:single-strand DNA-binding protein